MSDAGVRDLMTGIAAVACFGLLLTAIAWHREGTVSQTCFANNTCMPGLVCLHGAGVHPGLCASADGGAP